MFDKIIIKNGKIVIEKYTVEWVEAINPKAKLANNRDRISRARNFADKEALDKFAAELAAKNIAYTIKDIPVLESAAVYEGQIWLRGRASAIKLVNGLR